MDIWIILNGEKSGPFHDFEVRRKIEAGELPAGTPAWHDGLPAWKPLEEIPLFEREFDHPPEPKDSAYQAPAPSPPPLPDRPVLIRRFFARWLDLYLYSGLWWWLMWVSHCDIAATLLNPWVILLQYIPWFALETYLLHRIATTPGKWLLGLRVVNLDSSHLSLGEATRRSIRVLVIGLGFGWGLITLICQTMAYITAGRFGRPLWDHLGAHRVTVQALHPMRIVLYVFCIFASLQIQMMVVAPYIYPYVLEAAKPFPSLRKQLENNPPWQLPAPP